MLREAKIIAPKFSRGDTRTDKARAALVCTIVAEFGGATVTEATGWWIDPSDPAHPVCETVYTYTFACDPEHSRETIFEIARSLVCHAMKQKAAYVVYATGEVELIEA
jgi:hypothetical protein